MPTVKISCPHCSRTVSIDASKLPKQRASFGCPGCKGKIVVDPAEFAGDDTPAESKSATPVATTHSDNGGVGPLDLELPPGATLPPGVIIGADTATVAAIRKVVEPYGCELEQLPDAQSARARSQEEVPPLVFYVAGKVTLPPLESLAPITSMAPAERRRTFVVLVGDNVTSLDGRSAFLYLVNVTVATKDVEKIPTIVYSAYDYHNRLYRPLFMAIEADQS
ncbi:MAG: hypothetical protein GY906_29770 [bacterium]|nr:hypothetical protein [bacterium]